MVQGEAHFIRDFAASTFIVQPKDVFWHPLDIIPANNYNYLTIYFNNYKFLVR